MDILKALSKLTRPGDPVGVIPYGRNKQNGGSHDHRTNQGADRTQAQKAGDEKRRKP